LSIVVLKMFGRRFATLERCTNVSCPAALDTRLDGDARVLTLDNGREIRELIVDVDDEARRLAYAVVSDGRLPITYHHASFQVLAEGPGRCRVVWITDVLPNSLAAQVRVRIEVGAGVMKRTLEAQGTPA
jgi:Polyketide cyclase / dehydrase and lipid transport